MNMKKIGWIGAVVLFIGCTSTDNSGVKLTGNVENHESVSFVHLERVTEDGVIKVDTIKLDGEGNFTTYVEVPEPSFYRMNYNNRQYVTLILNGEEQEVVVNADGNDPRGFSEVSGSYDTDYKAQMDQIMTQYREERAQYQQQQMQARNEGDASAFNAAGAYMAQLGLDTEKQLKQLIWEASPSLAAIYGLQMIDVDRNYMFLDSVARDMSMEMPDNFHVTGLIELLDTKKSLAIGSEAPELSLQNPDGEVVTLSSLRGNYVLIDFWAAWCRPCRAENPNVVRVYQKYSDQNFEILGVSLDRSRDAWLKAIEADGLPWIHVSDLKFWNSEAAKIYQIHSIPATYLVDPDGKIIAKNLRGSSLEAKLKEIFG
ncbi:MAG: TlpA disulfide reductase family protein [Ekhidna sp.]